MVKYVIQLISRFRQSDCYPLLKWGLMSAALFWMLVFLSSESAKDLPNFVYVNF